MCIVNVKVLKPEEISEAQKLVIFNILKPHLHYAQFLVRYGKNGTDEIFNCPIVSQISTVPILSVYTMFNFSLGTDKTEIDEIWTT